MEKINKRWVLAKRPDGMPEDECWKLEDTPINDLDDDQILIKVMWLSIDPYMRGRMNDMKSYTEPVAIGEVMTGESVGQVIQSRSEKFQIGKGLKLKDGNDVTIVATGHLVWEAIKASEKLAQNGINAEIINIHTIKPLDEDIILKSVSKTGCLVSAEEHNIYGGLGESISRLLVTKLPSPQEFVGTKDTFGESGPPSELMNKYGLNSSSIYNSTVKVLKRK